MIYLGNMISIIFNFCCAQINVCYLALSSVITHGFSKDNLIVSIYFIQYIGFL